jgi:hypothetical protein
MKAFNLSIKILLSFTLIISGCRQIFGDREQPESIVEVPIEASNIIVRSPTHGTICNPGDTIFIKWIAPTIQRIDIQLYRKSEFKFMITKNIENSGRFDWIIPIDIPLSNHYLIKVTSHNNPDIYNFSGRFGIQQ